MMKSGAMSNLNLHQLELTTKANLAQHMPSTIQLVTILEMIDRIRELEARQTELQARNTELVEQNRKLTGLEEMHLGFEHDKKVVRECMGLVHGVPPSEEDVESRLLALYLRMQAAR